MATTMAKQDKMKRLESRKSHSWWWDSHVSPKNKWLQENLEVMDGYVKRMLKLIEEDADSFAKRAEMYYKSRPELINLVEEFYRMYRALSERYDIVAGELRKRVPSDIQSQSSGFSDTSSDLASTLDQNIERHGLGPRAAGFDIFLGGANKLEKSNEVADESLSLDSESESEDSLVLDYGAMPSNDEEHVLLRRRITELEAEINEVKEKSRVKFVEYEEQMNDSMEKIKFSEEELNKLKDKVKKYRSLEYTNTNVKQENEFRMLEEELNITKEKLLVSESEVENLKQELNHLKDQLGSVQNDVSFWKTKLEDENNVVSKLQDQVLQCESSLSDRYQEIKKLKEENSRIQADIDGLLKESIFSKHNVKEMNLLCQSLQKNVSKLEAEKQEMKTMFGSEIDEKNTSYETLLTEKRGVDNKITVYIAEIDAKNIQINEMNKHLHQLHMEHVELIVAAEGARKYAQELKSKVMVLQKEVEMKQEVIEQGAEEKREAIRQLCLSLEYYRNGYHRFRQAVIEHKRLLPVMAS